MAGLRSFNSSRLVFAVFTAALAAGCEPQEQSGSEGSQPAATTQNSQNAALATPPPSAERDAGFKQLPPAWSVDSDGNEVPDFIETQLGYDPARDDCPIAGPCGEGAAGTERAFRLSNTLVILDSSGSMAAKLGGTSKIELAKRSLAEFIVGMHDRSRLGFMVYGHKGNNQPAGKAESCRGVELLAPVGGIGRDDATSVLARFEPRGWTPIAASLEAAKKAFPPAGEAQNRVILVSDGLETCGGDPVAVARQLKAEGLNVEVDVVGFDVGSADAGALKSIADAGGGKYINARTHSELNEYFRAQVAAASKTAEAGNCEFSRQQTTWQCDIDFGLATGKAMQTAAAKLDDGARIEAMSLRARASTAIRSQSAAKRASARQRWGERREEFNEIIGQNLRTLDRQKQAREAADAKSR